MGLRFMSGKKSSKTAAVPGWGNMAIRAYKTLCPVQLPFILYMGISDDLSSFGSGEKGGICEKRANISDFIYI